jgi:hypothetical protein
MENSGPWAIVDDITNGRGDFPDRVVVFYALDGMKNGKRLGSDYVVPEIIKTGIFPLGPDLKQRVGNPSKTELKDPSAILHFPGSERPSVRPVKISYSRPLKVLSAH